MSWQVLDLSMLRAVAPFAELSDKSLMELATRTQTREFSAGAHLFEEGDPGDAMYLILNGEVRISKDIPGVGEEALAFLKEGAYFGEMALVGRPSARSAAAIASAPLKVARLGRADFQELLAQDKEAGVEILSSFVNTLAERLRASNEKLAFFAMSDLFE